MSDIREFDEMWATFATATFGFPEPGGVSTHISECGAKWHLYLSFATDERYKWRRETPLHRDGWSDPGADLAADWNKPEADNPISPKHYQGFSNGAEVIDITENLNFNRGNSVKYAARAGAKDPAKEIEDLKKSRWYLDREIARLEREAL
ncbi:DUF3310 domain-containing protein [Rhodococcus erythropolis]|uniref:DUF3310 domain-containing protein n=1 Tax=Rhodococcus erythropolis TaxID=1833 RepID=UPI003670533E